MPTDRSDPGAAARALEADFLALVCADEELLRAEFEAIIAAEWPARPPRRPGGPPPGAANRRPGRPGGDRRPRPPADRPRRPHDDSRARQRAPPAPRQPDRAADQRRNDAHVSDTEG